MPALPQNHLEKTYAGVLGKLIGVYLGRPFENWTYQDIQARLGPITYYVHSQFDVPLVVIDDDVSGTFTFVRALEEHPGEEVGEFDCGKVGDTWLNQVIDKRTVFWWGGHGISTEHTVFNHLKRGVRPPVSGSEETNGRTLAEQIGAQIFIDGWAMVCPGNAEVAAKFAREAARVSHDGVAVDAAVLWAVMEAEAFVERDVDKLLDRGLGFVGVESALRKPIADVRAWVSKDGDWERTRQRIEDAYGYDKYGGICHMIPNHLIMIMAVLYAGHDFTQAMHIINTAGWDTDCNSGNVGCLVGIINGLEGFENDKGLDWRGPLADRALISSADGGYSINDAVRITYDLANIAHKVARLPPPPPPKNGAQWHFTLPGSVQGFQCASPASDVQIAQTLDAGTPALSITLHTPCSAETETEVLTQTFTPQDALAVKRDYELMACPLISPGQTLVAVLSSPASNPAPITATIRLKAYDFTDALIPASSPPTTLAPGATKSITWTIPASLANKPIQQLGVALAASNATGTVYLHSIKYSGTPCLTLSRPPLATGPGLASVPETMWTYQWVSSIHKVHTKFGPSFFLAQDAGEGMFYTGTRAWEDYSATATGVVVNLGEAHGVVVRVQGLNRWYGVVLRREGGKTWVEVVKARDAERVVLGRAEVEWGLDVKYEIAVEVEGDRIAARFGRVRVEAVDGEYRGGAAGFVLGAGSICADSLKIAPV
ncbi:ADP-ribosylglycohydrolase [Karstenula rhodostoma CBS 690.94]|uniref:ADP-ribosylglycohydrolase n=1 Tax=Karstenula rhodostoma CBS 690.94 TaxID=1392251 RepID=A0A9P4P840_9PLEO|nr:ADP-ribosylglycohydrolase [Karstenula rhodostoma CBS 690.94]